MKFSVRGSIIDLIAFVRLIPNRRKKIRRAPATPITRDDINGLAKRLHPDRLNLVISEVRDETPTTRTFRLVPDPNANTREAPFFLAGQYLSVRAKPGGSYVTRPYSLSSSPLDAHRDGYCEITVRKKENGFFTGHIWDSWRAGVRVETSGPAGFFTVDPIRDSKDIVALAGGCGVTPFRSMMRDLIQQRADRRFTLLYGIPAPAEIIYRDELVKLQEQSGGKIAVHCVCSEPDASWTGPTGFLTAETIRALAGDPGDKSFFICGPPVMYRFLDGELEKLGVPRRRIRKEQCGEETDVARFEGFPAGAAGKTFALAVRMGGVSRNVPASSTESLLVAMERAGIVAPSLCRSGECGCCRSRLLSGDVFVRPDSDGRRAADRQYGFVHACATYPLSDVELEVPGVPGNA